MKLLNEIQQTIKAPKTQKNTHGGYMYRSCSDILSAVKSLMGTATVHMTDDLVCIGDRNYVRATVTITHDGETESAVGFAREAAEQKGMNAGQLSCSTSSYARKLALSGLFGIDDSHDAGNGKDGKKPILTKKEIITNAHAKYVADHANDIAEHFSIPAKVFQDAVMEEAKKQIPVADRKKFAWTPESVVPFVAALDIVTLIKEDQNG